MERRTRLAAALADASAVVVAWGGMLVAENVALGFLWRAQFSAAWEVTLARRTMVPIALAAVAPASLLLVAAWELARRASSGSGAARRALGVAGALAAAALAVGISNGRHFASWGVRGPFVAAGAGCGAALGAWLAPAAVRLESRPARLGALGLAVAVGGWVADAYVLPRLYPAFHVALLVASLAGGGLAGLAVRRAGGPVSRPTVWPAALAGAMLLVSAAAIPGSARSIERAANVRIALVEHAPLAGRALAALVRLRPPEPESPPEAATVVPAGEIPRSLDWSGHDVLLVSVDALRADHVSAYGYPRATTPNLDGLAREGTLFESAYCPTPHTSYSITSMMTGKYLRPLLALGVGSDSETWAQYLRRYGWRTAAFYPPAVFFIDEDRFERFQREHLGFEYAKVEFAAPALRQEQVAGYLETAPVDRPLFLWVHFFEPHEPYVAQPDHVFSGGPSRDVDAYDGEVATADEGIGRVVRLVRARHPDAVVIVTADHGEEFGEHGGRYHGTTVYEEQVRVPLVVVGPGVRQGARATTVVQTIDLLPTALSALGIPRPARVRGRDLGPALAGGGDAVDPGLAIAETDDASLVASGEDRLICERRAAACALYRPRTDPLERDDVSDKARPAFDRLRGLLRASERDHGRFEGSAATTWPEALRRGMQGDVDAATDVASLLDDADVAIRRAAAEVCFGLHAPVTGPALGRALARDEDDEVRRWCALGLVRLGEPATALAEALVGDPGPAWRRRAALAFAERGDPRGCDEIAAWWNEVAPPSARRNADGEPPRLQIDLAHAQELLAATGRARCRGAVGGLLRALDDVRARPFVADALGTIGDRRAAGPLVAMLSNEPYVTTRPREARALLALGVRAWAATDPREPAGQVHARVAVPGSCVDGRLLVLVSDPRALVDVAADGAPLAPSAPGQAGGAGAPGGAGEELRAFGLPAGRRGELSIDVRVSAGAVVGLWVVARGPT
jgi:HEAT repeat protein